MTNNEDPATETTGSSGSWVDAKTLWSGGAATALVAALIALVGILICRWLFNVPILAPRQDGTWGNAAATWGNAATAEYAAAAMLASLVATAIMPQLLLTTPRPRMFFAWIMGLATVIAVLFPFATSAPMSQKVATAIINLVLGCAIGSLVRAVAARSIRRRPVGGGYQSSYRSTLGN